MEILISHEATPSGVGISYEDGDLIAFSWCCGSHIVYQWAVEKWICKTCEKQTHQCDEGSSLWRYVEKKHMDAGHGLYRWLESWTDIPRDQISVDIT